MNVDEIFDLYEKVLGGSIPDTVPGLMMTTWRQAKEWGWPVDSLDPSLGVWAHKPATGPTRFGSVDGEGNFYSSH